MAKKMNKEQLARKVAQKLNLHNAETKDIIETIFELIIDELQVGNAVNIVGFGAFEVRSRIGRVGRNPQTGDELFIPATRTPAFAPGKNLRDCIKGKTPKKAAVSASKKTTKEKSKESVLVQ